MLYGQVDYPYGEPLRKPEMKEENPIRLYAISEGRCEKYRWIGKSISIRNKNYMMKELRRSL